MRSYYVGSDETQVVVLNLLQAVQSSQKRNQEIQDMLEHPSTISWTCVSTSVIGKKSLVPTVLYI